MHLERHPNTLSWRPNGEVFAEVTLVDGIEARCWWTRDKPAHARCIDGVLGPAAEGALL